MFKPVTVAVTALLAGILGYTSNAPAVTETVKVAPEMRSASEVEVTRRDRDSNEFAVSRGFKVKQQVVLNYARWYAKTKLGYSKKEWEMVRNIWLWESSWNWKAENPTSGAFGIAQMKTTYPVRNPFRQVELGFKYIEHRYGNPTAAYDYWLKNRNY
jgi:hypothetical protein